MKSLGPAAEIWQLEIDLWQAVQQFDLVRYRGLWHRNFIGWPHFYDSPQGVSGVTAWLAENKAKGRALGACRLRLADMRITGNVAVVHYRLAAVFKDGKGKAAAVRFRISHTWLRTGRRWQIIGGMSLPEDRRGRVADPVVKPHRRPSRRG
jgi:ketosteroid isomerase-like protein